MPEPTPSPPRPGRRRFTLSLRALMVLVLIAGVLLGWRARRASIQRRAVGAITAARGSVEYDYEWAGGKYTPGVRPWAPEWLRRAIGDEYFQEPTNVFLQPFGSTGANRPIAEMIEAVASLDHLDKVAMVRLPVDDAGFARLADLPRLKTLFLLDIDVTAAGLDSVGSFSGLSTLTLRFNSPGPILDSRAFDRIARQTGLKHLELTRVQIPDPTAIAPLDRLLGLEYLRLDLGSPPDDACLEHLRGLTGLKTLDLRETRLTDAGTDRIAGLDKLEQLMVNGERLTEAGFVRLTDHRSLNTLWVLPAPQITDVGLASVARLPSMNDLKLPGSHLTDAGLALLDGMKFDHLNISGLGVTDAGLAHLSASSSFLYLTLSGTSVTDAGLLALVQAAPGLRSLDVRGTQVTAEGVRAANKVRPSLDIEW